MSPSNVDGAFSVGAVASAGDYVALVNESGTAHYDLASATVAVFDLRTGTAPADRGGESVAGGFSDVGIDQLVLGSDGDTAAHTHITTFNYAPFSYMTTEQIVANDSTGTHILDSITTGPYDPTTPALSDLALSGDTLTWSHSGNPESAQLN
jgi:hypothetical protein